MKTLLIAFVVAFLVTFIFGLIVIPLLRRLKAGQTVLKYVEEHKSKNGTPTMGGLFFILSSAIVFLCFGGGKGSIAFTVLCIGIGFMIVGFIDDFIKIKFRQNEGLTARQKILFQGSIAIIAGVYAYINQITVFYLPFSKNSAVDLGAFSIPLIAVLFIAMTNSVNLTDGLDGLAGSTSAAYLIFLTLLIAVERYTFNLLYYNEAEYNNLILLSTCLLGGILGFLIFNVNKAKVFMGDTGSLSLGGFLAGISVFSSNSFFAPILGVMFVISSLSVIIQVAYYKKTKKRVFLMAPYHHHLQLKGYTETQISFIYSIITCIIGVLLVIFYL